jgi:hypothetical protein
VHAGAQPAQHRADRDARRHRRAERLQHRARPNTLPCLLRRTEQFVSGRKRRGARAVLGRLAPGDALQRALHRGHALPEPVPQHRPRHARVDACLRQRPRAGGHSVWPAAGNRFRLLRRTRRTSRGRTKAGNSARGRCLSRRSSRR